MDPLETISEEEIISGLRHGSLAAQEELIKTYEGKLYRAIRNQGVPEQDAEELLNDTFCEIITSIDTYRPKLGSFSSWVYTIAKNKARDWYRHHCKTRQGHFNRNMVSYDDLFEKNKKDESVQESTGPKQKKRGSLHSSTGSGKPSVATQILADLISNEFSEKQQEIIRMRYMENLEFEEIYEMVIPKLYPSQQAVRTDLTRLKKRIFEKLKDTEEFKNYR